MALVNSYRPELIYFDDTALPLWPGSDVIETPQKQPPEIALVFQVTPKASRAKGS